jgi:hypothetical protein
MKAKCISQKEHVKERFFLLMIVPFFIGLMIAFISIANAEGDKNYEKTYADPHLKQGWNKYDGPTVKF